MVDQMKNTPQETDKIQCRECGKFFDFLAPHVSKVHQMSLADYRERRGIPRQQPLASISYRNNCRANVIARIKRGDLCPKEQVKMMQKAYKAASLKPGSSLLHKVRASEVARRYQIWMKSPVIRPAEPAVKKEAIRRMQARTVSHERVKDIAEDLNLSISRLYAWFSKT
ncbi:MucR family transcriptional regulator [Izhakiella australiensis]|uniref:MucR family transcriptional regulator n=1 Tax=Izhakiella australiensis TaxID=1926881 RepID=UPI000BBDF324|nr:MucR family transcriptional regulator [Izhakiella australiensis]